MEGTVGLGVDPTESPIEKTTILEAMGASWQRKGLDWGDESTLVDWLKVPEHRWDRFATTYYTS